LHVTDTKDILLTQLIFFYTYFSYNEISIISLRVYCTPFFVLDYIYQNTA